MSLKSLVTKSVDMAFQKAGDLATIVILYKKDSSEYNFNTQETVVDDEATVAIKGLQLKKGREKPTDATNSITMRMLFKTKDIPSGLTTYGSALINSITWNISPVSEINDYTTIITFVREK